MSCDANIVGDILNMDIFAVMKVDILYCMLKIGFRQVIMVILRII